MKILHPLIQRAIRLHEREKRGLSHRDHPDGHLTNYYGEAVKVLVVDERKAGEYDTVYVDLNNNHDFRNDPLRAVLTPEYEEDN